MSAGRQLLDGKHTVEEIDGKTLEYIHKFYPRFKEFVPLIKLQPEGWFLPQCSADILDHIQNFEFKSDDVMVSTFPKSGSTWIIEIIWNLLHNANLDNPLAKLSTDYRAPYIEASIFTKNNPDLEIGPNHPISQANEQAMPGRGNDEDPLLTYAELAKSPRVLKTHLPYSLLPKSMLEKSKTIYVARDPRDIIASRFHYVKLFKFCSFSGSLDDLIDLMVKELVFYQPYFKGVKEALDLRSNPNVLVLYFENLKNDQENQIEKINEFLGAGCTKEQVKAISDYTGFKQMKERSQTGAVDQPASDNGRMLNKVEVDKGAEYFRKGKVGDWKDTFNPEQVRKIEGWITECTKDFPPDYPYFVKGKEGLENK